MWITIKIDGIELSVDEFAKKMSSTEKFLDIIKDIENIEENWNRIHINIIRKPKEAKENELMFRQI